MILMILGELLGLCFSFCPNDCQAVGREQGLLLPVVLPDWRKEKEPSVGQRPSLSTSDATKLQSSSAWKLPAVHEGQGG